MFKRSDKGLLTADNCVVKFIDLQPQMLFGVANFDRQDGKLCSLFPRPVLQCQPARQRH
jgi:hypothetical protein